MSFRITQDCNNCAACEPECPNNAISEGDDTFVINAALCTECVGFHGVAQCAAVCPVDCCEPDPAHAESDAELIERAKKIHPDKTFDADYPSRHKA